MYGIKKREAYASLSSKSLGMVISSTRSTRLDTDSSSNEMDECFRQVSKDGSVRKTASSPSSFIMGWFLCMESSKFLTRAVVNVAHT